MIKCPKKLIEVALPLDDINAAAAREKSIRHGHPSTLHLWWARRPLAAARAVIFAQMVNDPLCKYGANPTPQQKSAATKKREVLFDIIRELVQWENTNNEKVLERARQAIRDSWVETCELNKGLPGFDPEKLPAFHDPFAGGGAIPLEAQRLGLESYASDLNPVPVMINKAMIEIPPKFAGRKPIGPIPKGEQGPDAFTEWKGAAGLAEDVRRYGYWMREEAKKRIGHLYPKVKITAEMVKERPDLKPYLNQELTVIAWLWARTVKSPDPRFSHVDVPLVSSFVLSSKKGKEAYVEPVVEGDSYRFTVKVGTPPKDAEKGTKLGRGANFMCIMSGQPMKPEYIRQEGLAKRMGARLMAIVAEGTRGRVYIGALDEHIAAAKVPEPTWKPETKLPDDPRNFWTPNYGLNTYGELFTDRQLTALNTFSDLVQEARQKVLADSNGDEQYANAVAVYLTFSIGRAADRGSSICTWDRSPKMEALRNTFGRQAIPMAWDFAEGNVFSESSGNIINNIEWIQKAIEKFPALVQGSSNQADAQTQKYSRDKVISTDPPYYDNIGYADLSDFFYVWMRRGLRDIYPDLFATMAVPKAEELVATPYRHGGKEEAESFFLNGMTAAMHNLAQISHAAFPVTIYYAFKQSETGGEGTSNAGWETFLEAVITSGFAITGTWPMRTEMANRMIGSGTNALASSIVLVCRKRDENADEISRRDFLKELHEVMPEALRAMQGLDGVATPVAPVDMAQAAIGPGMEVFSKFRQVINADGSRMSVHDAILEINSTLIGDDIADAETLFCRKWFDEVGWGEGQYGKAQTLAQALGTSVEFVKDSSVLESGGGKAQLVHWKEYPKDYDPAEDSNRPCWEAMHNLVRALVEDGEVAAGRMLAKMPEAAAAIRDLAYTMYTVCERRGFTEDARAYNALVTSWPQIQAEAMKVAPDKARQGELFDL